MIIQSKAVTRLRMFFFLNLNQKIFSLLLLLAVLTTSCKGAHKQISLNKEESIQLSIPDSLSITVKAINLSEDVIPF